jgi:predicted DsbA family dithiol-disulfide isomerase
MQIDVISDVVCPWCFIGKRRLEKALAKRPDAGIQINWHPFQLNPDMPEAGRDHKEYYREKFGGDERVRELVDNMTDAGAAEGLEFDFAAIEKSPNTLAAHRLVRWAASAGHQGEVVEALFQAYFIAGRDIGDQAVLAEIAGAAGMDAGLVAELYAQGRDITLVEGDITAARQLGIRGVPFFIFDHRYSVAGAQKPEVFLNLIDKILAEGEGGE